MISLGGVYDPIVSGYTFTIGQDGEAPQDIVVKQISDIGPVAEGATSEEDSRRKSGI